jgi:hypothetical protein
MTTKIINMTPHELVLQIDSRSVSISGDAIIDPPGFCALAYSFQNWNLPYQAEAITESDRNTIIACAAEALKEHGIVLSLDWEPMWNDQARLERDVRVTRRSYIDRLFVDALDRAGKPSDFDDSLTIRVHIGNRSITARVDITTLKGSSVREFTIHLPLAWNDGSPILADERAELEARGKKVIISNRISTVNRTFED